MSHQEEEATLPTQERPILDAVPTNESDRHKLVFDQPRAWEWGLYGAAMIDQLERYEPRWRDYVLGYVAAIGPQIRDEDLPAFLLERQTYLTKSVDNLNGVLTGDAQERAFGKPGEPGDPVLIEHLARRLIDTYGSVISWVESVRGARVDESAERAVDILSQFADQPIKAVRSFVEEYVDRLDALLIELRADPPPENPTVLDLTLTLSLADSLVDEFGSELKRLRKRLGHP